MGHVKSCDRRGSDVLHSKHNVYVAGAVHIHVCIYCSLLHVCAYAGPLLLELYERETERYTKHCNVNKTVDSS